MRIPTSLLIPLILLLLAELCVCRHHMRAAAPPPIRPPRPSNESKEIPEVVCQPYRDCEPCPKELLHEPYCQPFGNRRLLQCPLSHKAPYANHPPPPPALHPNPPDHIPRTPSTFADPAAQPHPEPYQDSESGSESGAYPSMPNAGTGQNQKGEAFAWESCGRIIVKERADFWEFVFCNVVFAGIGLIVLGMRSKKVKALQARRLAARIGWGSVSEDG